MLSENEKGIKFVVGKHGQKFCVYLDLDIYGSVLSEISGFYWRS